ncbi:MAG: hypothetical protein ABI633_08155 [Burkholderiales bacterium]
MAELCAFAAREGDVDPKFTPAPTGEEGIAGHRVVASRRGSSHRADVTVTGEFIELVVRGRADGYYASRQVLEDVKTFKGHLIKMPANHRALHWAQAKVHGWLVYQAAELPRRRHGAQDPGLAWTLARRHREVIL